MPPASLTPISRSGDFKMDVSWEPVPDGFVHGILLGYRIYYRKVQELGRASTSETEAVSVGPFEQNTTVTMLKNFAVYDLQIAAFTIKGVGVLTDIKDGCKFSFWWYSLTDNIPAEKKSGERESQTCKKRLPKVHMIRTLRFSRRNRKLRCATH